MKMFKAWPRGIPSEAGKLPWEIMDDAYVAMLHYLAPAGPEDEVTIDERRGAMKGAVAGSRSARRTFAIEVARHSARATVKKRLSYARNLALPLQITAPRRAAPTCGFRGAGLTSVAPPSKHDLRGPSSRDDAVTPVCGLQSMQPGAVLGFHACDAVGDGEADPEL